MPKARSRRSSSTRQGRWTERHIHVEDVLLVAMIAVLRKVITLDIKELPATTLIAVAAVIVALAAAYWLMRRSMARGALSRQSRPGGPERE